jgi:hypothetical protein
MKYEAPEIVALVAACAAIQGAEKMGPSVELTDRPTISAYEADE